VSLRLNDEVDRAAPRRRGRFCRDRDVRSRPAVPVPRGADAIVWSNIPSRRDSARSRSGALRRPGNSFLCRLDIARGEALMRAAGP